MIKRLQSTYRGISLRIISAVAFLAFTAGSSSFSFAAPDDTTQNLAPQRTVSRTYDSSPVFTVQDPLTSQKVRMTCLGILLDLQREGKIFESREHLRVFSRTPIGNVVCYWKGDGTVVFRVRLDDGRDHSFSVTGLRPDMNLMSADTDSLLANLREPSAQQRSAATVSGESLREDVSALSRRFGPRDGAYLAAVDFLYEQAVVLGPSDPAYRPVLVSLISLYKDFPARADFLEQLTMYLRTLPAPAVADAAPQGAVRAYDGESQEEQGSQRVTQTEISQAAAQLDRLEEQQSRLDGLSTARRERARTRILSGGVALYRRLLALVEKDPSFIRESGYADLLSRTAELFSNYRDMEGIETFYQQLSAYLGTITGGAVISDTLATAAARRSAGPDIGEDAMLGEIMTMTGIDPAHDQALAALLRQVVTRETDARVRQEMLTAIAAAKRFSSASLALSTMNNKVSVVGIQRLPGIDQRLFDYLSAITAGPVRFVIAPADRLGIAMNNAQRALLREGYTLGERAVIIDERFAGTFEGDERLFVTTVSNYARDAVMPLADIITMTLMAAVLNQPEQALAIYRRINPSDPTPPDESQIRRKRLAITLPDAAPLPAGDLERIYQCMQQALQAA